MEHRNFAVQNALQQLLRLMDSIIHMGEQHRLAVKTGGFHIFVSCHNNAIAGGNLIGGQHILGAIRAIGFNLAGNAKLLSGLVQCFGGHVGVGNAVGAGGNGQHAVGGRQLFLSKALVAELGFLLGVNRIQKFFGRFGGAQLCHKVFIHQHLHQAGQHINVQTAVFRCGNHKQQIRLAVIVSIVLHGGLQAQGSQTGAGHAGGACMRHRNAVIHIGGSLRFTRINGSFVRGFVGQVAVGGLQLHQFVNDLRLVRCGRIQRNGLDVE